MEQNTFKRDIISQLKKWKDSPLRKPLVLRGARQVGKTTVVNQFSTEFDNYLYVNLDDNMLRSLFQQPESISNLITLLFAIKGLKRKEGSTLLFLDEVQNSPEAMARLRYFYEEAPEIHVIAAGSLLEKYASSHLSFPVGRVEFMAMRPCSFREFMVASGEEELRLILETNPESSTIIHEKLQQLWLRYSLIGGMPEIIRAYVMMNDIESLNPLYETLIEGYKEDSEKYISSKLEREVLRHILLTGWSKAGETITLSKFGNSEYRSREVREAFTVLEKALLVELTYPTKALIPPFLPHNSIMPKLFWIDSGLVNYASGIRREVLLSSDIQSIWKGRFAEQLTAQELLSLSNSIAAKRLFWVRDKKGSDAEVDFIHFHKDVPIPIEVKTGHNSHLRSLHAYLDLKEDCTLAIRIWSQPFSIDSIKTPTGRDVKLINLPFYLIGFLPVILDKHLKE